MPIVATLCIGILIRTWNTVCCFSRCCKCSLHRSPTCEAFLVTDYAQMYARSVTRPKGSHVSALLAIQQESKVCIQTCALLYIAAFPCIPNCHRIMSHLTTGDYVIKFERNSFRVQLSARGIATCFASAQPKAQVSGGVDCLCLCLCLCLWPHPHGDLTLGQISV